VEKKEAGETETLPETYGVDLGIDLREEEEEIEAEIDEWAEVDFSETVAQEKEKEKESVAGEEPTEVEEPFSPDAVADDDAMPMMTPPSFKRQHSYVVLGKFEINQRQKSALDEVIAKLDLPESRAIMLLRAFDWEPEKAIKAYTENSTMALKKAGVSEEELKKEKKEGPVEEKNETIQCQSCFCDVEWKDTFALEGCGHRYCLDCWQGWCRASFENGQECVFTECMFGTEKTKCHETLPPEFTKKQLSAKQQEKFQEWQNVAFVKQSGNVKWCPRAGCDKAVEYKKKGMKKR